MIYFYRAILHFKTTGFIDIPSPPPEKKFQSTKLTVHVSYTNQVMSPHIQKLKIEMRVSCYYFSILLTDAFSYLLSFPWLHIFFCMELPFCPLFFLHLLYLWVLCYMLSLVFRIVLLIVAADDLCVSVLTCTILVGQLNKILVLSPRPLRACMDSIEWYSKICAFGVTLGPRL